MVEALFVFKFLIAGTTFFFECTIRKSASQEWRKKQTFPDSRNFSRCFSRVLFVLVRMCARIGYFPGIVYIVVL